MKGRLTAVVLGAMAVVACSDTEHLRPQRETPECRNYRIMMTAPLSPEAHERLKLACERSAGTTGATRWQNGQEKASLISWPVAGLNLPAEG